MIFTKSLKHIYLLLFLSIFFAELAFAHGEDKPGPHGGIIRMPSGFHIEVVPIAAAGFKVYLLDIYFKDPTIRDSKVSGTAEIKAKTFPIKCQPKTDHYECTIEGADSVPSGKLKLNTVRDGMNGAEMTYDLPFQTRPVGEEHSR